MPEETPNKAAAEQNPHTPASSQLFERLREAGAETRKMILKRETLNPASVKRCCKNLEWIPDLLANPTLPEPTGRWIGEKLLLYIQQDETDLGGMEAWIAAARAIKESSVSIPRPTRRKIFEQIRKQSLGGSSKYLIVMKMQELQTLFDLDWWWEMAETPNPWRQVGRVIASHPGTRGQDVPRILKTFPDDPPLKALRERKTHLLEHPQARRACLEHHSVRVVALLLPGQNPPEARQICNRLAQLNPLVGAAHIISLPPKERAQLSREALLPFLSCPDRAAREMIFRALGENQPAATTAPKQTESTPTPPDPTKAEEEAPRAQNP